MNQYYARINRVIDYIEHNIADEFTLEQLAGIACFSKYHFHRIFHSLMHETLFHFIYRLRLERAASRLAFEINRSITDIALECGFTNPASFSKSFKEHFHESPTVWRRKNSIILNQDNSNLSKSKSNTGKETRSGLSYNRLNTKEMAAFVKQKLIGTNVINHPETWVIYVRNVGPYKQDMELFKRLNRTLFTWAYARELVRFPDTKYLVIAHDDPEITEESKQRISVCLTVPPETETGGDIGKMNIPAGRYAHLEFALVPMEIKQAWEWAYGIWLPDSGFVPDDRPSFELYHPDIREEGPLSTIHMDICIPVKPLEGWHGIDD
jgi:AraC family transcriptional regulator